MASRRKRKRDRDRGDLGQRIDDTVEEVGGIVSEVVVEVGDAVSAIVESVAGGFAKRQRETPAERLVRKAGAKRSEWTGHRNTYIVTNIGLAALNVALSAVSGDWTLWFVFPLLGWGIGLGIHGLNYRSWLIDKGPALEAAEAELLRIGKLAPARSIAPSPSVAVDPQWSKLVTRCKSAVAAADNSLARKAAAEASSAVLPDEVRGRLQEGLKHLERLAEGAVLLRRSISTVAPEGLPGLRSEITELERRIAQASDPSLAEVYRSNRDLLAERATKIHALQAESERMLARGEGFLIAVQNIQLDVSRLGVGGPGIDTLTEPLKHLSDEVRILQQVEAELADIT